MPSKRPHETTVHRSRCRTAYYNPVWTWLRYGSRIGNVHTYTYSLTYRDDTARTLGPRTPRIIASQARERASPRYVRRTMPAPSGPRVRARFEPLGLKRNTSGDLESQYSVSTREHAKRLQNVKSCALCGPASAPLRHPFEVCAGPTPRLERNAHCTGWQQSASVQHTLHSTLLTACHPARSHYFRRPRQRADLDTPGQCSLALFGR
ncbi:hypothetical protein C8Q80DRAFT_324918 [Daedaleopsis nitida]|nr:hypothetical protein C8Q80DRAFT_324918 [Daedaleopsis nitida]